MMIWQIKVLLMQALHKRSESAFRIQRSDFLRFIFTKTYFFSLQYGVYMKNHDIIFNERESIIMSNPIVTIEMENGDIMKAELLS